MSKSPTDEYRVMQYRLCAINMQKIEKLRWKNFVYVQDSLCLFLAHTDQQMNRIGVNILTFQVKDWFLFFIKLASFT